MSRRCLVLRPEPGDAATCARLRAAGLLPVSRPLFVVRALDWAAPDVSAFDSLLLTSANAVRHAGAGLASLAALPVIAVGKATAGAARAAGLRVAHVGTGGVAEALASVTEPGRILHLAGRDRTASGIPATAITVYVAEPVPPPPDLAAVARGSVALLHSVRVARRFAMLMQARDEVRIAAISAAVAAAAGDGWNRIAVADRPDDDALVARAATLAIDA